MTNKTGSMSCALTCWLVALLGGLLAAAMLMAVGGWTFWQAVFAGVVIFAIAGLLLSWILCRPLPPLAGSAESDGTPQTTSTSASSGASASPAPAASAAPVAATASTATASDGAAGVKPSTSLPGQEELATRKGSWTYTDESGSSDAGPEAAAAPAKDAKVTEDYDGDGVLEGENEGTRPEALSGPRDGKADNLKEIKGIGPKLEKLCNSLGFYHFDQIANWSPDEVAWVNANLEGFKGRVTRDTWVEQAKILAAGGETAFSKKVEKGGVYD